MGKDKKVNPDDAVAGEAGIFKETCAVGDLKTGSTLDSVICAETRYHFHEALNDHHSRKCFRQPWFELMTTVALHFAAQSFQMVLLVWWYIGFGAPIEYPFRTSNLKNMTGQLNLAIQTNNFNLIYPETTLFCSMNVHYPWSHRIFTFVVLAQLLPEIGKGLYRLALMFAKPSPNHHHQEKEDWSDRARYTWEMHERNLPSTHIWQHVQEMGEDYTRKIEYSRRWRDGKDVDGEFTDRLVIDNKSGIIVKFKKPVDEEKFSVEGLKVTFEDADPSHHIGAFSQPWRIFLTSCVILPHLIMSCVMTYVGVKVLAYTGPISKMVKIGLKVKFLVSIPEQLFRCYACQDLKVFLDGTHYYTSEGLLTKDRQVAKEKILVQDDWSTWKGTVVKVLTLSLLTELICAVWFSSVDDIRQLCTEYYETFEGKVPAPAVHLNAFSTLDVA